MKLDYGKLVKESLDLFKSDIAFYIVGCILVSIASSVSFGILAGPAMVGFVGAIMKRMSGENASYNDIVKIATDRIVLSILATLAIGFAVSIGSVLLVIPGLIVAFICSFVPFIIIPPEPF